MSPYLDYCRCCGVRFAQYQPARTELHGSTIKAQYACAEGHVWVTEWEQVETTR